MARRRYFIRHLPRLPEARYDSLRDSQRQAQPLANNVSEHPRQRLHRVQRDDRHAEAVAGADQGIGDLEIVEGPFPLIERKKSAPPRALEEIAEKLERISQAVDATAVEVERIGKELDSFNRSCPATLPHRSIRDEQRPCSDNRFLRSGEREHVADPQPHLAGGNSHLGGLTPRT